MKITVYCHFCVICYTIIKIKLKDCDSMADVTHDQTFDWRCRSRG